MKKWAAAVLAGAVLVGCSEPAAEQEKVEKVEKVAEVEKVETPEPEPVDTEAVAEEEYAEGLQRVFGDFQPFLEEFSALNIAVGEDPTLMLTDAWIMDMAAQLVMYNEVSNDFKVLEPPAKYQAIHAELEKVFAEFDQVYTKYPKAVDAMDMALMGECVTHITTGTVHIKNATMMIESLELDLEI